MLQLDNVSVCRGNFRISADFSLPEGTRAALIGPSGGGKSTILAAISGLLEIEKGRISAAGQNLAGIHPGKRPFSIIFQDNNHFPHMTARQNVGLGLRPDLRLDTSEIERVDSALKRVGLEEWSERRPGDMSGGQQSRISLARVLVQDRPWMLLDEPFSALGPSLKTEMLALVKGLCDETGAGLLMVTHDPNDAVYACEQTILVADNSTFPPQETGRIMAHPPSQLADYLGRRSIGRETGG